MGPEGQKQSFESFILLKPKFQHIGLTVDCFLQLSIDCGQAWLQDPREELTIDPDSGRANFVVDHMILDPKILDPKILWDSRRNLTVDPAGGLPDLVVDAWLLVHRATKPCARDPDQRPP